MSVKDARPVNILLVEDDDDDVHLINRSLDREGIMNSIARVSDGVEAMAYLRQQGDYEDVQRPDLILLDLNMPRKDGREVLKECYEDEVLRQTPIVVFTSSDDEHDVLASYGFKASSYITKPVDLLKFREVLNEIRDFYCSVVTLPPHSNN